MNFRNLRHGASAPHRAHRAVHGADPDGLVSFARMEVQQQPDIEFPIVIVRSASPAPRPPKSRPRSPSASRRRSARSRAWIDQFDRFGRQQQTQVQFQLGEDINAAVSEVKNMVDQAAAICPTGFWSRRSSR
jgi:hypothetical protein